MTSSPQRCTKQANPHFVRSLHLPSALAGAVTTAAPAAADARGRGGTFFFFFFFFFFCRAASIARPASARAARASAMIALSPQFLSDNPSAERHLGFSAVTRGSESEP